MAALTRSASLLLALLAACGEPLVGDDYQGERIAAFTGSVIEENAHYAHARAAVFWSSDVADSSVATLHEQASTSRPVSSGGSYQLNLFEPPGDDVMQPWGGESAQEHAALGRVLVYDDANQNGKKDPAEHWAGALKPYALLYAPSALPARTGLSQEALPAGLHVVLLPLPCGNWMDPAPTRACDPVPLLQACTSDAQCGAGSCVDRLLFPWPGGACLVPLREDGCEPSDGAILRGGPDMTYWTKRCSSNADCPRGEPYVCDLGAGACMPRNPPLVAIGTADSVEHLPPFCAAGPGEPPPTEGTLSP